MKKFLCGKIGDSKPKYKLELINTRMLGKKIINSPVFVFEHLIYYPEEKIVWDILKSNGEFISSVPMITKEDVPKRFNIDIQEGFLKVYLGNLEIISYKLDFPKDIKIECNLVKDKFIVIGSYIFEIIFLNESIL